MSTVAAALLLDLDGVLVDTEGPILARLADHLAANGVRGDVTAAALTFRGKNLDYCADELAQLFGGDVPASFVSEVRGSVADTDLRPEPGAVALLASPLPFRVVTNSTRTQAEDTLERAGLLHLVRRSRIVSVDVVGRAKPAPDLHLAAVEDLRVPATCCLAIEDSLTGLRAARAAGVSAIGYAPDRPHWALLRAAGYPAVSTLEDVVTTVVSGRGYREEYQCPTT